MYKYCAYVATVDQALKVSNMSPKESVHNFIANHVVIYEIALAYNT